MKRFCGAIMLLLIAMPAIMAYDVGITVTSNDIVREDFRMDVDTTYDSYEFQVPYKPMSVIYGGEYLYEDGKIILFSDGSSTLEFSLIFDGMVEGSGRKKAIRADFDGAEMISLKLPPGYVLADGPSAIPKVDSMETDGEHIILNWVGVSSIAVFYEGGRSSPLSLIIFSSALIAAAAIVAHRWSKKRIEADVSRLLSDEENKVLEEIRKGVFKQNDISRNLGYSKSKMSKVIRKLEEKGIVDKKPHYKTNIIRIR